MENKFTGPAVHPGDKIMFTNGDKTWTKTIDSISYKSGGIVYKELTRWESLVRRLTPKRWRRPIPSTYQLPTVTLSGDGSAPLWRAEKAIKSAWDAVEALVNEDRRNDD
ncbi:hypothetical protein [Mycobacterium sp. CnD-18-1]|uniref:hypothetical protein n=1 Tax=Mycobacterium sp. CnD-18-1 TaxID=2917744 RepID=UPI001EF235DC|nr:hypothetical protein [Mycobacterium sp. CnD-18-1]MCG7607146.1 hypothetical protein [Mycobacterium sp. CnD-18-1]